MQGIIAAAEKASADIERDAREKVQETRDEAMLDAARIREDAIAQARTLVAAVTQATSVLLERVGSMDGELATLVESLRAGATRLTGDLDAVKGNMGELYDAASDRPGADTPAVTGAGAREIAPSKDAEAAPRLLRRIHVGRTGRLGGGRVEARFARVLGVRVERTNSSLSGRCGARARGQGVGALRRAAASVRFAVAESPAPASAQPAPAKEPGKGPAKEDDGDLDGARLIALNMALNGESRAAAERYLAEHFQLADRAKLIDEVYAAIEA